MHGAGNPKNGKLSDWMFNQVNKFEKNKRKKMPQLITAAFL
ncbi:hypothetical protein XIS1_1350040 [Xenorhabdus innexi]|uniref:Uncharacterized protein n=1 Tax=Xenorhabdus innexi TaxID=290109 RepID=A0A1N6MTD8_9GAMM|nr:hypothetical protein XIS1_1350040 [Xenorhabdus innexi]